MKLFTVAGVSTADGQTKARFTTDLVTRSKYLSSKGHTNVNLFQLPKEMTKKEAIEWLRTTELYNDPMAAMAIDDADGCFGK